MSLWPDVSLTLAPIDQPRPRRTDPETSALAAASIAPANRTLIDYIHRALDHYGPMTHARIAREVERYQPGRWTAGSIVSACARADLIEWDREKNARKRWVIVWARRTQ